MCVCREFFFANLLKTQHPILCMGEIKLIRFPNTFRIEFSQKEFVCNKGHYSLSNIEKEMKEKGKATPHHPHTYHPMLCNNHKITSKYI